LTDELKNALEPILNRKLKKDPDRDLIKRFFFENTDIDQLITMCVELFNINKADLRGFLEFDQSAKSLIDICIEKAKELADEEGKIILLSNALKIIRETEGVKGQIVIKQDGVTDLDGNNIDMMEMLCLIDRENYVPMDYVIAGLGKCYEKIYIQHSIADPYIIRFKNEFPDAVVII